MDQFNAIKEKYINVDIPVDLESRISNSFKRIQHSRRNSAIRKITAAAASFLLLLTLSVNVNQDFAMTLSEIPFLGQIVKVLSFKFDVLETENVHANIEAPVITGLENETLQAALNQKYYDENKALYENFKKEMAAIEEAGGHLGIDSGFEIKTDTERILSIGRYYVNTVGSSSTTFTYDTVDKIEGIMVTLPSLFVDESYIERISTFLIAYMKTDMIQNPNNFYWVTEEDFDPFKAISPDQNFYLTDKGKLVISFDKYTVAPGYMGVLEFEIPTDIISDLLVSDQYVK
jgi:hypothetical protein